MGECTNKCVQKATDRQLCTDGVRRRPLRWISVAAVIDDVETVACRIGAVDADDRWWSCCVTHSASVDEATRLRQWQWLLVDGGPVDGTGGGLRGTRVDGSRRWCRRLTAVIVVSPRRTYTVRRMMVTATVDARETA